jgi:drug/metabolite transporter (DMT)-like permease
MSARESRAGNFASEKHTTAFFGVVIGRERASRDFWVAAIVGTVLIGLLCSYRSGLVAIWWADVLLLLAFGACSYGYAEGGLLAKKMGGWQVICWVLVLAFPVELVALAVFVSIHRFWITPPSIAACAGLLYVTAISQYIGFYFYYEGLALGGVARMSQVQLFLPFCAIVVSHFVLGEVIDAVTIVGAILITITVFVGRLSPGGDPSAFGVRCSLFTVRRSGVTVHRSPFTVHRSPFGGHRSAFAFPGISGY